MVRLSFIMALILMMFYCCKNSKLSIDRENYDSGISPLRLDGFYYEKNTFLDPQGTEWVTIYFLYNNGVLLNQSGIKLNKPSHDIDIKPSSKASRKSTVLDWGIFNIQNNTVLEFEKWEPSSGGGAKTNIYTAEILNDSTFVVKQVFSHYNNETYTVQDTFHFMPFSPKPDSTNVFIP